MHIALSLHFGQKGNHGADEVLNLLLAKESTSLFPFLDRLQQIALTEVHYDAQLVIATFANVPHIVVEYLNRTVSTLVILGSYITFKSSTSLKAWQNS